jgi:SAM-dependent methyltransferase
MAKFEPESYRQYRVQYPENLFDPLRSLLGPSTPRPLRVLDLGAGTGNSAASFYRFYSGEIEFTLVDPDPKMLQAIALEHFEERATVITHASESHLIPQGRCESEKFDLVLIGSAWHWMNAPATLAMLASEVRSGGGVFVFEYQFPKAVDHAGSLALNEWVRREFNLKWKEPSQKPRGSLRELTEPFRNHSEFSERSRVELKERALLRAEDFHGVIVSQSRYLAYERSLLDEGVQLLARESLLKNLTEFWSSESTLPFEYGYEGILFRARSR